MDLIAAEKLGRFFVDKISIINISLTIPIKNMSILLSQLYDKDYKN